MPLFLPEVAYVREDCHRKGPTLKGVTQAMDSKTEK